MLLVIIFVIGVILVIFGIFFIFFPKLIDDLSNLTSQVIINIDDVVQKKRRPIGIIVFLLGAWMIWFALTTRNYL